MKLFRYWDRKSRTATDQNGYAYDLISWSGSNTSLEDARDKAAAKLAGWIEKLNRGESFDEYEYAHRGIREELIKEIHDSSGELIAAITRNRYGALVLNSASILIADVDAEERTFFQTLFSFLGSGVKDKDYRRQKIAEFAAVHPDLTLAVYETHSGFRVFILGRDYDPTSRESTQLLQELGSDPLYVKLCAAQKCYRARLTPKPWRCGISRPPNDFPRTEADHERAFDTWLRRYQERSGEHTTCRHEATYGKSRRTDHADHLLRLHDEASINTRARDFA